jgi:hypothetical protein
MLRAVWAVTALAVAGVAAVAIVSVLRGDFSDRDVRTIMSLVAVFLCGSAAIAALHLLERPRLSLLGGAALAAAPLELVLFLLGIWKGQFGDGSNDYVKLFPTALAWVIVTIVAATLPLITDDPRLLRTLLPGVVGCAIAGATIATVLLWTETDSEGWGKTLAVLAILMVAGYILTPIAHRFIRLQGSTR